jgi:hypothetical protein
MPCDNNSRPKTVPREAMTQYLLAVHYPDDCDSSVAEDEAMSRDIDALNDEMKAAAVEQPPRTDPTLDGTMRGSPALREDPIIAPLARATGAIARLDQGPRWTPARPGPALSGPARRRPAGRRGRRPRDRPLAPRRGPRGPRPAHGPQPLDARSRRHLRCRRHAFDQYQWLVTPDFDQEGEVQAAEKVLATASGATPLLAGARGLHAWIDRGGDRRAGRAAPR